MAVQLHVILAGGASGLNQRLALGDLDLGLHNVDACHFLGHSMFNLHAWVHLDEVERAGVHIHQKFDGARAFVIHGFGDAFAQVANLFTLGRRQIGGRRALNHLLVAALHRTIAFPQMIYVAMAVAQDLHLDVTRTQDHLFQIALAIAKSGLGLAAAFQDFFFQLVRAHDRTHTASAATPAGL